MSFAQALVIVAILGVIVTFWIAFRRSYSHGRIIVDRDSVEGKITFSLEVDVDPYEIEHMKNVSFKVIIKDKSTE